MLRIIHYENQFFGRTGDGDHAGMLPVLKAGPLGPGVAFASALRDMGDVVATVVCGDDYMMLNKDEALRDIVQLISDAKADVVIAGPAFNAGRYGLACGAVCKAVRDELGIPALTGMYPENPGAEFYAASVPIIETDFSIAGMRRAVPSMAALLRALVAHGDMAALLQSGENIFDGGVLLLASGVTPGGNVSGFDPSRPEPASPAGAGRFIPAPALREGAKATIGMVTEGGLVPVDNPDMLGSYGGVHCFRYTAPDEGLLPGKFRSMHGGIDKKLADAAPERLLPVSALRRLATDGRIGEVTRYFYSTVGNGASAADSARMGRETAAALLADGVNGVILTAT